MKSFCMEKTDVQKKIQQFVKNNPAFINSQVMSCKISESMPSSGATVTF